MTYHVDLADEARVAIRDQVRFIAVERGAPGNAERWVAALMRAVDQLASMPQRYPVDPGQSGRVGVEVRKMTFGDYLLHYRIDDTEQRVEVLSFRHGSRRRPG